MPRLASCLSLVAVLTMGAFSPRTRAADEPAATLPVVVLVGDSIRLGYAPFVAERLKGIARVVSPEANGGDSANLLKHLDEWVIRQNPAVVHFNAGLHDLKTDPKTGAAQVPREDYARNLAQIIARLERETSARLIFATTTPVIDARHQASKPFLRREADVRAYNRAAFGVVETSPIVSVDDLHALVLELGVESALVADGVHNTPEAARALGRRVAQAVLAGLDGPPLIREAVCRWAVKAPQIDGKLDDPVWDVAAVIDRFPAYWSDTDPGVQTRARLLWNDDALYYAATMTDTELTSFGTRRNETLWLGDVFELFFKPADDRDAYYEFQVNPRSVILELPFSKRGDDFATLAAKPTLGMSAIATADGTVNQGGDHDRGWAVEGRIPWSAFAPTGGRPTAGAIWRFALCRYDYGAEGTKPRLTSSAPLRRLSFHRYEDYGRLRFEGPRP